MYTIIYMRFNMFRQNHILFDYLYVAYTGLQFSKLTNNFVNELNKFIKNSKKN